MPPVSMPKSYGADNAPGGPREMVRVQLKKNDVRSYSRADAEKMLERTPGAFIVGEEPGATPKGEGKTIEEAAEQFKAQAGAANKARPGASTKGS